MARNRSAALLVSAQTASKLADVLCDAKTVLTWLMGAVGAPAFLTAWLVPVRESGSMLPQVWLASAVKRFRHRKWAYAVGAMGQGGAAMLMAAGALVFSGRTAAHVIVSALALLALCRALCSIASKDVLGRVIDKGARGRIGGLSAALSGAAGAAAALAAIFWLGERSDVSDYSAVVAGAGALFVLAAAGYALINEPGEDPRKGMAERPRLRLLLDDATFRNFVLARGLLLGSALGAPYIVMLGQRGDGQLRELALFMVAGALASAMSSPLWGAAADRSAHTTMAAGGVLACVVGAAAVKVAMGGTSVPAYGWPALFFLFNLGYAGVRLGRKTYVVDIAEGNRRTDYVALSNSVIAALLLLFGAIGSGLSFLGPATILAGHLVLTAAGSLLAAMLPRPRDV